MQPDADPLFVINVPVGTDRRRSKVGYIDRRGTMVILPRFDDGLKFSEGLAAVKLGIKWGFIDRGGEFAISPAFHTFSRFHEGFARMRGPGRWGIFRPLPVRTLSSLDQHLREILRSKRLGFIDRSGKLVVGYEYTMAGDFAEGAAHVQLNNNSATLAVRVR